uniref:Metalloendopeptidase n=1 Tax=Parastrongyloides trichosuri TaxID=131310 RepID=A0A0N4ZZH5_PARTI
MFFFLLLMIYEYYKEIWKRAILVDYDTKWPLKIKYHVGSWLKKDVIKKAINQLQELTCIVFEESSSSFVSGSGILFVNRNGVCESRVGKSPYNNSQEIFLTTDCSNSLGVVLHELGHVLGLLHEHQRDDRWRYVWIEKKNIKPGKERSISIIYSGTQFKTFDIPYDFGSIMHYPSHASSISSKKPTIQSQSISLYNQMMGQLDGLSFNDARKLNRYYCLDKCRGKSIKCENGGYQNWRNCQSCTCPRGYSGNNCSQPQSFETLCSKNNIVVTEYLQMLQDSKIKKCNYHFKSENGKRIQLKLSSISTKKREICSPGYGIEIKYTIDKSSTGLCLCGTFENIYIITEGNEAYIEYHGLEYSNEFLIFYADYLNTSNSKICYDNLCVFYTQTL